MKIYPKLKKYLILTFDMEEFFGNMFGLGMQKEKMYELCMPGTERILELTKRVEFKATFFFTLTFAKYCPWVVKEIMDQGHEIACHGYDHSHDYSSLSVNDCRHYISESKEQLQEIANSEIYGFRAPNFFHPQHSLLKEIGFLYDSSVHPTIFNVGKRLKRILIEGKSLKKKLEKEIDTREKLRSRHPFEYKGIFVVPVTVSPIVKLPFSWIWFRNGGLKYAQLCSRLTLINENFIHLYFHPYDFSDINKAPYNKKLPKYILRNCGSNFLKSLERYILWTRKSYKLQTTTLIDLVKNHYNYYSVIDNPLHQ